MTIDTAFAIYALALTIVVAITIGGFTLIFMELHRLNTKFDAIPGEFTMLRHELAEEFRAQRAEVSAQVNAIANAINASR